MDADKVQAYIKELDAQNDQLPMPERSEIDDGVARVIASWWYSGNLGYSFVTTGAVPEDSSELWRELFSGHYDTMNGPDKRAADLLGTYLLRHVGRGPVSGWHALWV